MLKKLDKLSFFSEIMFSYVDEGSKLKLAKYNKNLQKKFNLSLINYKFFSGRYIKYELEGKGKEIKYHNSDNNLSEIILYKGEYLNGKRNGKGIGKEKNNEFVNYEGEYLNGKKHGKGKEHQGNILIYEGEYLNGLKNGKGKEYLDYGKKLIFEGEYFNGKKWNGKAYYKNKIYLLKNGKGFIRDYNFCYDTILEGEYLHGEKNRKGKEYYDENQLYYEGEYLNGKKSGKGKLYYPNGELEFDGEFLYGYKKRGKKYFKEKLVFEGDYLLYNIWNGKGYDEKGNIIYELINGNGKVKEYNNSGILEYEGEYKNGKRNGKGKEYDEKGKLIFEGEFKNGNKLGVNNQ